MRGLVPSLASPVPLLTRLPGILQDDGFLQRMLPAFDDALAPAISTLDNLAAYLDPALAPADFVDWLAAWVDVEPDGRWTLAQRREFVASAVGLHRRAGTPAGIRDAVRLVAGPGTEIDVAEGGGAGWSPTPGGTPPGDDSAGVVVTVAGDVDADTARRVERILTAYVPAHVPWRVIVPAAPTAPSTPEDQEETER